MRRCFVQEGKEARYESSFKGSRGALDITPRSWFTFAWDNLRRRTVSYMNRIVTEIGPVLVVGVGTGDILPHIWQTREVLKIGIDVNKEVLEQSKEYCDPVLASASQLPVRRNSIHLVFFDLVLHHLKGQKTLGACTRETHRVLVRKGKIVAIEPNSLNFSGLLMNVINTFHMYSMLFGGSSYEYALSTKEIRNLLSDHFEPRIGALTLLHPRFPMFMQRFILKNERFLLRKFAYFAWMFLITAQKN